MALDDVADCIPAEVLIVYVRVRREGGLGIGGASVEVGRLVGEGLSDLINEAVTVVEATTIVVVITVIATAIIVPK